MSTDVTKNYIFSLQKQSKISVGFQQNKIVILILEFFNIHTNDWL